MKSFLRGTVTVASRFENLRKSQVDSGDDFGKLFHNVDRQQHIFSDYSLQDEEDEIKSN